MSNLQQRVISAIILAAIVLSLTWFGGLPFRLLAVAIGALVFYEWTTVSGVAKDRPLWMAAWTLVALVLAALIWSGFGHWILAGAVAASAAVILFGALRGQGGEAGGGMFYALLAAIALAQLRGDATSGLWVMIYLFAVVWATDIFAYFVGRAIGGPKLAPSISPGKTWSGAVGGVVFAVLAAIAVALAHGGASPLLLALLAVPLSIVSQAGDLFESRFKRRHGVKDSSRLIPGHGGVMDRVDGLVVAAAALYLAGLTFWSGAGTAATLFPG